MKKQSLRQYLIVVLLSGFILNSHAGLKEAIENYKARFQVRDGSKFDESPFKGWYYVQRLNFDPTIFNESVDVMGFGQDWNARGLDGKYAPMTNDSVQKLQGELRKNLRTDWLVDSGIGNGSKAIVVISAPNCPACKYLNEELKLVAKRLDLRVLVIPTLLGRDGQMFEIDVMCSPNPSVAYVGFVRNRTEPQPQTKCRNSDWVDIVKQSVSRTQGNNRTALTTPTIINQDGTMVHVFEFKGLSDAEILGRLGFQ